jgi:hypothetical protein
MIAEGARMLKVHWRKRRGKLVISVRTISKQMLERQEGREWAGSKLPPKQGR